MRILITGGAGYIGSITNAVLIEQGHETVVFDNLSLGHRVAIGKTPLIVGDLKNFQNINDVFQENHFDAVVHFAAYSLAGESMEQPYAYYQNNIIGSLNLLEAMRQHGCNNLIFSSTSSVYGYPKTLPVTEDAPIHPESVYGSSKRMVEELISWYGAIYGLRSVILRYFNAAGATPDGLLGEDHAHESHIIPIALQVAAGVRPSFDVYGDDYATPDGTCIRDYIHVLDLATAHAKSCVYLEQKKESTIVNLGVGRGYSNNEVLDTIERVTGRSLNRVYKNRRPGDPACVYADNAKARAVLGWVPQYSDLQTIIETAWHWHQQHPNGYADRD